MKKIKLKFGISEDFFVETVVIYREKKCSFLMDPLRDK